MKAELTPTQRRTVSTTEKISTVPGRRVHSKIGQDMAAAANAKLAAKHMGVHMGYNPETETFHHINHPSSYTGRELAACVVIAALTTALACALLWK